MESGNYNKTSGRKTLILVILLMTVIVLLSIYSVFHILRKSAVVTNSSYYDKSGEAYPNEDQIIPK